MKMTLKKPSRKSGFPAAACLPEELMDVPVLLVKQYEYSIAGLCVCMQIYSLYLFRICTFAGE